MKKLNGMDFITYTFMPFSSRSNKFELLFDMEENSKGSAFGTLFNRDISCHFQELLEFRQPRQ